MRAVTPTPTLPHQGGGSSLSDKCVASLPPCGGYWIHTSPDRLFPAQVRRSPTSRTQNYPSPPAGRGERQGEGGGSPRTQASKCIHLCHHPARSAQRLPRALRRFAAPSELRSTLPALRAVPSALRAIPSGSPSSSHGCCRIRGPLLLPQGGEGQSGRSPNQPARRCVHPVAHEGEGQGGGYAILSASRQRPITHPSLSCLYPAAIDGDRKVRLSSKAYR